MTNRATETAGHREVPITSLLERLRGQRLDWISRLEPLTEDEAARSALHPRLRQPLRLVELGLLRRGAR
jgi:hypothetical protein